MSSAEDIKRAFGEALNKEGYSFAQAVIYQATNLNDAEKSAWRFHAGEFPVEAHGHSTRIDMIFGLAHRPVLMLGECKRSNPSHSDWVFVNLPYVKQGSRRSMVLEVTNRQ